MTLILGTDKALRLPDDAVTETFGFLGARGAGKSNATVVMAEAMWDAHLPWVAVDPKGDWWGIRSSADGKTAGLALPIFGGLHGDVPLEPNSGTYVADLIFEQNLTALLDVSRFSGGERNRFLTAFFHRLYQRHQAEPTVRHVFLEEAHLYCPQFVTTDLAQVKEATAKLVLEGRSFGLGASVCTQRSARLHKDVLSQVGTLVAMRTGAKLDRDAIKDWMTEHDMGLGLIATLPKLQPGQAWLWSPSWLKLSEQVTFRPRRTFDSGATPKVGVTRRPQPTLADVDLAAVKAAMAETIERAQADDPKWLRKRIAGLEQEVAAALAAAPARVEVPVVSGEVLAELRAAVTAMVSVQGTLSAVLDAVGVAGAPHQPDFGQTETRGQTDHRSSQTQQTETTGQTEGTIARHRGSTAGHRVTRAPGPHGSGRSAGRTEGGTGVPDNVKTSPIGPAGGHHHHHQTVTTPAGSGPDSEAVRTWAQLGRAERAVLTVLAQHRDGRTRTQLALLTGYSVKASTIGNALGALRSAGLVERGSDPITATTLGLTTAAGNVESLPAGRDLYRWWADRLGKAEQAVLDVLVAAWPEPVSRADLVAATGYSATASTLGNALGKLRSLHLVEGWHAADDFMEAINA